MRDLDALRIEPGTVLSAAWVALYGPPLGTGGVAWSRLPSGDWRAERAVGLASKKVLDRGPVPVQYLRRRAA